MENGTMAKEGVMTVSASLKIAEKINKLYFESNA